VRHHVEEHVAVEGMHEAFAVEASAEEGKHIVEEGKKVEWGMVEEGMVEEDKLGVEESVEGMVEVGILVEGMAVKEASVEGMVVEEASAEGMAVKASAVAEDVVQFGWFAGWRYIEDKV